MEDVTSRSPLAFFALLFLLSVPFWVAGSLLPDPAGMPMGLPVSAFQFVLPLVVACVLLFRRHGWRGIAALVRRTASPRGSASAAWWVVAVALVPALLAMTHGIMLLADLPPHGPHSPLATIPVLLVMYGVAAGCEEAGWTGYVLEPLERRWGPLAAALVIGVVWAVWHLVAFVQADRSPMWIVGQCLSTVAIRVLMVWLVDSMGGVVLAAVVVHTLINVTQSVFPGYTQQAAPALVFGLVCAGAAAVVTWYPRRRRSASPDAGTQPRAG